MSVWGDAVFLWHPGQSSGRSYDLVSGATSNASLTEGTYSRVPGRPARYYNGTVGSRFAPGAWTAISGGFALALAGHRPSGSSLLYFTMADASQSDRYIEITMGSASTSFSYRYDSGTAGSAGWPRITTGVLSTGTTHVIIGNITDIGAGDARLELWVDGVSYGTDDGTAIAEFTKQNITVGRLEDLSPANSVDSYATAAAAWDRTLTSDEIAHISSYPALYMDGFYVNTFIDRFGVLIPISYMETS